MDPKHDPSGKRLDVPAWFAEHLANEYKEEVAGMIEKTGPFSDKDDPDGDIAGASDYALAVNALRKSARPPLPERKASINVFTPKEDRFEFDDEPQQTDEVDGGLYLSSDKEDSHLDEEARELLDYLETVNDLNSAGPLLEPPQDDATDILGDTNDEQQQLAPFYDGLGIGSQNKSPDSDQKTKDVLSQFIRSFKHIGDMKQESSQSIVKDDDDDNNNNEEGGTPRSDIFAKPVHQIETNDADRTKGEGITPSTSIFGNPIYQRTVKDAVENLEAKTAPRNNIFAKPATASSGLAHDSLHPPQLFRPVAASASPPSSAGKLAVSTPDSKKPMIDSPESDIYDLSDAEKERTAQRRKALESLKENTAATVVAPTTPLRNIFGLAPNKPSGEVQSTSSVTPAPPPRSIFAPAPQKPTVEVESTSPVPPAPSPPRKSIFAPAAQDQTVEVKSEFPEATALRPASESMFGSIVPVTHAAEVKSTAPVVQVASPAPQPGIFASPPARPTVVEPKTTSIAGVGPLVAGSAPQLSIFASPHARPIVIEPEITSTAGVASSVAGSAAPTAPTRAPVADIDQSQQPLEPEEEALRRFGAEWTTGATPFSPTEHDVKVYLTSLRELHGALGRACDRFYGFAFTQRRRPDLWHHIWLTFHLAGATVEDVYDIVERLWSPAEQGQGTTESTDTRSKKRRLKPSEGKKLMEFVESVRTVLVRCEATLSCFDTDRERRWCLELYQTLRKFPISPYWKDEASWEVRDGKVYPQGRSFLSRCLDFVGVLR